MYTNKGVDKTVRTLVVVNTRKDACPIAVYNKTHIIAVTGADGDHLDFRNDLRHLTALGEQSDDMNDNAAPKIGINNAAVY